MRHFIDDSDMKVIVEYEMNKLMAKLIERVENYDCTNHTEFCKKRGKSPDECKGAQATAKQIKLILEDWEIYQ